MSAKIILAPLTIYFFADFDVMAVGPVIVEVSENLNRYRDSASSYPVERLLPLTTSASSAALAEKAGRLMKESGIVAYWNALHQSLIHFE
jgi:cardiolipin synthase C